MRVRKMVIARSAALQPGAAGAALRWRDVAISGAPLCSARFMPLASRHCLTGPNTATTCGGQPVPLRQLAAQLRRGAGMTDSAR